MFNIRAKNHIEISNLDVLTYYTKNQQPDTQVELFLHRGDFWPVKTDESQWTKIGHLNNAGSNGNLDAPIKYPRWFDPIEVQGGETIGLYFRATNNFYAMDNQGTNLDEPYFQNGDLSVHEGVFKDNW